MAVDVSIKLSFIYSTYSDQGGRVGQRGGRTADRMEYSRKSLQFASRYGVGERHQLFDRVLGPFSGHVLPLLPPIPTPQLLTLALRSRPSPTSLQIRASSIRS
jgi:hypothetical protein